MHTFVGKGSRIHYNSDISGDLIIQVNDERLEVPGEDIVRFVFERVISGEISRLESLQDRSDDMSIDEMMEHLKTHL